MPSRVLCDLCSNEISADDINVREGVAYCRVCRALHRLSDILTAEQRKAREGLIRRPPDGCALRQSGPATVIHVSTRALLALPMALAVTMFWNGVVWTLTFVTASATIYLLVGWVPPWMPNPGSHGQPVSALFVVLMWVFLAPFLIIGLTLIWGTLMMTLGRIEVTLNGSEGLAFTGIGPLGRTSRFDALRVTDVRDEMVSWSRSGPDYAVVIEWGRRTQIGSNLPEDRREWLCAALTSLLVR